MQHVHIIHIVMHKDRVCIYIHTVIRCKHKLGSPRFLWTLYLCFSLPPLSLSVSVISLHTYIYTRIDESKCRYTCVNLCIPINILYIYIHIYKSIDIYL